MISEIMTNIYLGRLASSDNQNLQRTIRQLFRMFGNTMTASQSGPKSTTAAIARAKSTGRLDLSNSQLRTLPTEISQLRNLQELDLSGNALSNLPPEICLLHTLQLLNVDDNVLDALPSTIGDLKNLRELHLDGNHLTRLPRTLGLLSNLRNLTINNNQLARIPSEIGSLRNLQFLMLNENKLTTLPNEIGLLSSLRRLWLDGNQLLALPDTVCQLAALERLHLRNNLLTKLPQKIGDLSNLSALSLNGNLLTRLIADVGRLAHLEELDLRGNILANLPPEIGNLSRLRELRLDENKLNVLPRQLAPLLVNGLTLSFSGNPVTDPLIEIAERGADALAAYLTSLDDAKPQYEAKVLLVGEGNVGKTSLVAALRREQFVDNRSTTHGIEIRSLTFRHPQRTLSMTLRTWDFGGQEIYRITHQFFFTKRALYLVVWSARQGQEQDEVEGWLSRIRLRVAGEASAIIVATHCSERRPEIDLPRLRAMYPSLITEMQEIDNRTGVGINELRSKIAIEAAKLPQMGQLISPRWTATRDDILARATSNPQISFYQFNEICRSHGVADREVRTLAELLHDLGQVIYYGDDQGLRDVIVLDPEWLTKAISYVLEDAVTKDAAGVLDHKRLREIWLSRLDGAAYAERYHPYFIRLMEKFDVSYRLSDNEHGSLVAQLVPHSRPDLPWDGDTPLANGRRSLAMICRLSEPAPGLMAWLTVRNHHSSINRHWRRGVFLRHPIGTYASEALLELQDANTLTVEVRAPSPDLFFNVLRDGIEHLITTRWPGIKYQLSIPCPTVDVIQGIACPGRFPLEGLLQFRENGGIKHTCLDCVSEHDISRLLTGFHVPSGSPIPELERLEKEVAGMAGSVRRLEGLTADMAESVRRVLRLASTEVLDCPRLFSVAPVSDSRLRRAASVYQQTLRVVLWCEHAGHWHPWPSASYELSKPKEWLIRIRPYATVIYRALKVAVPVAAAISNAAPAKSRSKRVENELMIMGSLLQNLPNVEFDEDLEPDIVQGSGHLAPAEGHALRAFRMFLFEQDPARSFGGLRRVQAPSGEVLWVCADHHSEYDPGLPVIPGPPE